MSNIEPSPMQSDAITYPRYEAFRQDLLRLIPHKPIAQAELESKTLPELIAIYLNWGYRFIPKRRRHVTYEPGFFSSEHLSAYGGAVAALERAISEGDDLNPYLSSRPSMKPGYVSRKNKRGAEAKAIAWQNGTSFAWDKDSCLNAYELHHLHLGSIRPGSQLSDRTPIVAFIRFGQMTAHFVHLGSHRFHSPELRAAVANANARRGQILHGISPPHDSEAGTEEEQRQMEMSGMASFKVIDGQVVMAALQAASGDSLWVMRKASEMKRCFSSLDPLLDDYAEVKRLFTGSPKPIPEDYVVRWHIQFTELLVCEEKTNQCCGVVQGLL
jgi:hypothetical protein